MEEKIEIQAEESAAALAADLRAVIGRLRRRLREQGNPGDLTWSQKSVLRHLEREGPATVSALARIEGVRPQSMGATIAALEAAGLVTGAPDPKDGRQTILSLTEACRRRLEAGRAARQDWLTKAVLMHLAPDERERLAESVDLLRRLAEE